MASAGDPISLRPVIYTLYETWGEMLALKQDLQPFQQIARAIEDCVSHGQAGVPVRQLGMQLMDAELLLLKVESACAAEPCTQVCQCRGSVQVLCSSASRQQLHFCWR